MGFTVFVAPSNSKSAHKTIHGGAATLEEAKAMCDDLVAKKAVGPTTLAFVVDSDDNFASGDAQEPATKLYSAGGK